MSDQKWKEVHRQKIFEAYYGGMSKVTFELPSGDESDYFIKDEKETAAVFAVTPEKKVILVKQFRPGPQKVLLELPGGYVDDGEEAISAARREFLEETNHAGQFQHMFSYYDCAYSTRIRHCYLATNCISEGGNDENVIYMPIEEFRKTLYKNPMTDIACALGALRFLEKSPGA